MRASERTNLGATWADLLGRRWVGWTAVLGCALLVLAFRYHGINLALDSDEGEYGYAAQRVLAGDRLYVDVFDNKPPQVHLTYALALWLFGDSDHSIRWLGIVFSWVSLLATWVCARQLLRPAVALWAALLFCFLNVDIGSHSHINKIETFIAPFLLGGLAMALRYLATRQLRWLTLAAFFVGVAACYKPWFAGHVPLLMALAWQAETAGSPWPGRCKRWAAIGAAAALPALFWLGWLLTHTDLNAAWDALVNFNSTITRTEVKAANPLEHWLNQGLSLCRGEPWHNLLLPLWEVGLFFALVFLVRPGGPGRPGWRLLAAWALLAFAEVSSGPRLSVYYFSPMLPLVALIALGGFELASAGARPAWWILNGLLGLLTITHAWRDYLSLNDSQITLAMWNHDVYKSFRSLGEELRVIMPPQERVFMWGFDTINFYSQRRSGSRYYFVTPDAFDAPRMNQLVDEVIAHRPMLFYENHAYPLMPPRLKAFLTANYEPVLQAGLFTLNVLKEKQFLWDEGVRRLDAAAPVPASP